MRYEVFARVNAGDETLNVGRVEADNDRLAKSYARTTFNEEDWDYMSVVAEENLVEVTSNPKAPSPEVDA